MERGCGGEDVHLRAGKKCISGVSAGNASVRDVDEAAFELLYAGEGEGHARV